MKLPKWAGGLGEKWRDGMSSFGASVKS